MTFFKHNLRFLVFLALTVIFSLIVSLRILGDSLSNDFIVQDDFRQTNFWFWNFWDSNIFTNDLFTNNYKDAFNLAPLYLIIFKMAPLFTDNLISFSKYYALVLAVLTSTSAYLFYNQESGGKNFESFVFGVFISFMVWTTDHLSAAHIRSSIWLILFLYLYLKYKKSDSASGLLCGLSLFFNPCAFLLIFFAEFLTVFVDLKFKLVKYFEKYKTTITFLFVNAFITIGYHFLMRGGVSYTGTGKVLTVSEMKSLAEFNPGGRHPVFGQNLWDNFGYSWWMSEHWGIGIGYLMISKIFIITLVLIVGYLIVKTFIKKNFEKKILLAPAFILFYTSIILNILAQITFPTLYMPSRYLAIPLLLLSCFTIFKICSEFFIYLGSELNDMKIKVDSMILKNVLIVSLSVSMIILFQKAIHTRFIGVNPAIAKLVSTLPENSMIAGFPMLPDINSLSIFAKRNVFIDYERSLSYTKSTLDEIRRRNLVAIQMTFAQSKEEFLDLAINNGITHYLALLDLYDPQTLRSLSYLNPYDRFMKQKIYDARGNFFLKDYLLNRKLRYALLDIAQMRNEV
jgi:hypothetical protein